MILSKNLYKTLRAHELAADPGSLILFVFEGIHCIRDESEFG